jgi:hypothetical protein
MTMQGRCGLDVRKSREETDPGSSLTSTLAASPASLARRASLTATMHEAYGNQY